MTKLYCQRMWAEHSGEQTTERDLTSVAQISCTTACDNTAALLQTGTSILKLSPAHTVRFWPRFGRLRQILKILKDSCYPRLKSVVFDRWFDISTDSRLMAVAINFFLRLNSGSVRRFQTLSCSVTSPTTTVKPRTNRCAEPDDAISATTSNHENVETSQVDSTTVRKTYWAMEGKGVLVWRVVAALPWQG